MKKYYKITPIYIIENDSGTYEVWCEKLFCSNQYRFFANQVGVKVDGKLYKVNKLMPTFSFFNSGPKLTDITNKCTIELTKMRGGHIGYITDYKYHFENFKQDVISLAYNKIIREENLLQNKILRGDLKNERL